MSRGRKVLIWTISILVLITAVILLGPREPAEMKHSFNPSDLGTGAPASLEGYLAERESRFDDINPGTEKQIVWADPVTKARTDVAIVYIHGYSASAPEIRPVPDLVAEDLGANLYFTRLAGHGRLSTDAMSEATVSKWAADLAEAIEIGRRLGREVVLMGTSTGATLISAVATDESWMENVSAAVFVSPNYAVQSPTSWTLTTPWARYWVPPLAGKRRVWEPDNEGQAQYWTHDYETVALLPMLALVKKVDGMDLSKAVIPAQFIYAETDQVVKPQVTKAVAATWPGASTHIVVGPDDDGDHVIAGDILSPNKTQEVQKAVTAWLRQTL